MFQTKTVEKIKTHIICSIIFFRKSYRLIGTIFGKKWCRNIGKYGIAWKVTDGNVLWPMCFARRIKKATNTHSAYVILIAFPLQQWLRERASILRYTYIACLVYMFHCHLILQADNYFLHFLEGSGTFAAVMCTEKSTLKYGTRLTAFLHHK